MLGSEVMAGGLAGFAGLRIRRFVFCDYETGVGAIAPLPPPARVPARPRVLTRSLSPRSPSPR